MERVKYVEILVKPENEYKMNQQNDKKCSIDTNGEFYEDLVTGMNMREMN